MNLSVFADERIKQPRPEVLAEAVYKLLADGFSEKEIAEELGKQAPLWISDRDGEETTGWFSS